MNDTPKVSKTQAVLAQVKTKLTIVMPDNKKRKVTPQLLEATDWGEIQEICFKAKGPIRFILMGFPDWGCEQRRRFWELLRQLPEKYRMKTEDAAAAAHCYYL